MVPSETAKERAQRTRDLRGDPGLRPSPLVGRRGRYVGTPATRRPRRFARDERLEAILQELARAWGRQAWWPADTPFEVVVGAILTQNTAWTNVERALAALKERGPLTPARLLDMPQPLLAETIRSSGYYRAKARKLAAISRFYLDEGGLAGLREEPLEPLRTRLLAVHGVGPETADSILCYAAGRPTAVVDTYTRRILGRHGLVAPERSYEETRAWLMERLVPSQLVYEEFHALFVRVGHQSCKPRARCEGCAVTAPDGFPA